MQLGHSDSTVVITAELVGGGGRYHHHKGEQFIKFQCLKANSMQEDFPNRGSNLCSEILNLCSENSLALSWPSDIEI